MMEFAFGLVVKRNLDGMKIRPKNEKVGARKNPSQNEKDTRMTKCTGDDAVKLQVEIGNRYQQERSTKKIGFLHSFTLNSKMDFVSFFVFILAFIIFNYIYWTQNRQDFTI